MNLFCNAPVVHIGIVQTDCGVGGEDAISLLFGDGDAADFGVVAREKCRQREREVV